MKKILAIMALALGAFFPGSAAAQPEVEVRPVDEKRVRADGPDVGRRAGAGPTRSTS